MNQAQDKKLIVSIDEATDGSRQVLLRSVDNDAFIRTGKQVIAGCTLGISIDLWIDELNSLIAHVQNWAEGHKTSVSACFIEPRPRCVMLFFVPASTSFDFDLADELVELNARLMKDFNVGMVETHQIPERELDRFLNRDVARQIYADPR
jgi:hypothetical protein